MQKHTELALLSSRPSELAGIRVINKYQNEHSSKKQAELKASQIAFQELLKQKAIVEKEDAKKINEDFSLILLKHEK